MTGEASKAAAAPLESLLAGVLQYGSWLASITIGLGLALFGMRMATAGIALFILLPALRVLVMLIAFLRDRDLRFSAIAAVVLTMILLGFLLGLHTMPDRTIDR